MYKHTVQYYETDKMGITHHSNYIRWMEEARIYFLSEIGFSFDKLESLGIVSPVVSVDCSYRKTTVFPEVIDIEVLVKEFNGVKLKLGYVMKNASGAIVCEATSIHCFLDVNGRPIRLHKEHKDFYDALMELVKE